MKFKYKLNDVVMFRNKLYPSLDGCKCAIEHVYDDFDDVRPTYGIRFNDVTLLKESMFAYEYELFQIKE